MKKHYLTLLLTFFLWGSIYVACKYVYQYAPPLAVLAGKYIAASLLLAPLAIRKGIKKIKPQHIKYFLFMGVVGYAIGVAMVMMSTAVMDATISSLINSMTPVAVSVMAAILLKEKVSKFTIIGIACSIVGVCIVLGIGKGGTTVSFLGMVLAIGGLLAWSFMTVFVRKISNEYSSEQLALYSSLIAIPVCIIGAVVQIKVQGQGITLNPVSIGGTFYIGAIATGIGLLFYNQSLKVIDASICTAFYPVQTLASAILGILLLGEKATVNFVVGAIVISAGVVLSIVGDKIFARIKAGKKKDIF